MAFVDIAAGTAIAGTVYDIGKGIAQNSQAKAINNANQRPTYTIPQEYYDNLNIANQLAIKGMPQEQYNEQKNAIDQNQAASIAGLSRSANPGANLSSITRASDQATGQLNSESAQDRVRNLQYAMQIRGQLAQQKLAQQQYNLFDKYTEQFNKGASLQGAGNKNINTGINSLSEFTSGLAKNYNGNIYTDSPDPSRSLSATNPNGNWQTPSLNLNPDIPFSSN